jgi:Rap1a immunity proteins
MGTARWLLVVAVVVLSPIKASASVTAGDLSQKCSGNGTEEALCVGYISGWADQFTAVPLLPENKLVHPQFKPNVTVRQMMHVFVKFIKDHPDQEHINASFVLIRACEEAQLLDFVSEK